VSLNEPLRCEDHHLEVRVFSHLNYLPEDPGNILRLWEVLDVVRIEAVQRESMAAVGIVQVEEDIDSSVGLGQPPDPEVDHELHTVGVVGLCRHHLVHKPQRQERKLSGRRQGGRGILD
jgi:hypothetical protein